MRWSLRVPRNVVVYHETGSTSGLDSITTQEDIDKLGIEVNISVSPSIIRQMPRVIQLDLAASEILRADRHRRLGRNRGTHSQRRHFLLVGQWWDRISREVVIEDEDLEWAAHQRRKT